MKYLVCQKVKIVDMNDEIMAEVEFQHGEYESTLWTVGSSVVTYQLGLKEFEVVYDRREGKQQRSRITDIEIDLITVPMASRVFLEPVTLIIGQHDIGQI